MKPYVQPRNRARWVIVALAALFLSGIVGSFIAIQTGWLPSATRNYGELVQPARPISDVSLNDLENRPVRFSELKGKWLLIYFGSAECLTPCEKNLYKMRQIIAAQDKEAHRLRPVFVVTNSAALDALRYTLKNYPATLALRETRAELREWAAQFAVPAGGPFDGLDRIYVVDPLGNFMMSYPSDADPRRMLKDFRLLLRASQIG